MKIRIVLIDDHHLFRKGLAALFEQDESIEIVGEGSDGREALDLSEKMEPDIMVMDISMPNLNGLEASRQILKRYPGIKIIILSIHTEKVYVKTVLESGISGFLLKDCAFDDLREAIDVVQQGRIFLSPKIEGMMKKEHYYWNQLALPVLNELSEREREVLQMLSEGKSVKEIAQSLFLSPKTIETHRKNIMDKLDMHTIPELVKYAIREGLTDISK
ncbi:response regulator [candidate division KSB1 bacterium]|nr:response regulator [candidate division KSB1 bacterium]